MDTRLALQEGLFQRMTVTMYILILFRVIAQSVEGEHVGISQADGVTTFWYNSSSTHVATYQFEFESVTSFRNKHSCVKQTCGYWNAYHMCDRGTQYICVTDNYYGNHCTSWKAVGWNTGDHWGYRPQSALEKKDINGKSLLTRMMLSRKACGLSGLNLILTIENPSKTDQDTYILGTHGGVNREMGKFKLKDMVDSREWRKLNPERLIKVLLSQIQMHKKMLAMADPGLEDTMAVEIGFGDHNVWLEWVQYTTRKVNKSNCHVCAGARPHLGIVPLNIPDDAEECFLSLYTNVALDHTVCKSWKKEYPIVTKTPKQAQGLTIYKGNYTCYTNTEGNGWFLGNFPEGYCSKYSSLNASITQNQVQFLGDIY
ncbi:uncharacterized protein LOC142656367 [Rhinoderma darwinii]|uniref:uncharacterized protein LOC142656367 n=1 Tax=Rhinoderma darwinii TaxID=43563 RepID=UPI003F680D77